MNKGISKKIPVGSVASGVKRIRVENPKQLEARRLKDKKISERKKTEKWVENFSYFEELGGKSDIESCLAYADAMVGSIAGVFRKRSRWIESPSNYPGRENVDVSILGKLWFQTFNAWLSHMSNIKKYEEDKGLRLALHVFCDYLFLYLPWWMEINPNSGINFPTSPKDFSRFIFMNRLSLDEGHFDVNVLPMTFIEFLIRRKKSVGARNIVISTLERYFSFVIRAFEDDSNIVSSDMSNPVVPEFDKERGWARHKTNKVPFYENVYPHLVYYSQALEAFGEYLMQLAYESDYFESKALSSIGFNTDEMGYVPYFRIRGVLYVIRWIPSVYACSRRNIYNNPTDISGIYLSGRKINHGENYPRTIVLPYLTSLRLIIGMIETGLRGQSIQWLDRDSWDSLNIKKIPIEGLYTNAPAESFSSLYVNTDKTRETGFQTFMSWRVRRAFLAEQHFQNSILRLNDDLAVPYEGRPKSRFGKIKPLFSAPRGKYTVSDTTYSAVWGEFLVGFQQFFNSQVDPNNPLTFYRLEKTVSTLPKVTEKKEGEQNLCKLSLIPIHTPHACRATYATLKDGDFEISEIANLIGHSNTITTTYYQTPEAKKLISKLQDYEDSLFGERFDIHPERSDSTLRRSFNLNRESSILNQGFISGVSFWSTEDLKSSDNDTLELLKQSPANAIKWHESHVCPVGNQCPLDIVQKIGGFRRCGICPLAAKSIDHLPGIAAKKRELVGRVRALYKQIDKYSTDIAVNKELLDGLHREVELDSGELSGWTLAEEVLKNKLIEFNYENNDKFYHADAPELVKRHLKVITKDISEGEFLLDRIADSKQYPSLESEEVRARASLIVRTLLAQNGQFNEALSFHLNPGDDLSVVFSMLAPLLKAKGINREEFSIGLTEALNPQISSTKHHLLNSKKLEK